MHETCRGVGVAVPWATAGVSREGLGSVVGCCCACRCRAVPHDRRHHRRAARVAVLAYSRIVLVPSGRLAGLVRLPCAQTCGLCLNADEVADLARRMPCAPTRGLCWCQAADWRDWCGCRARKRADCATAVVLEPPQPNVAACASVLIVLVALGLCPRRCGCCARIRADCAGVKRQIGGTSTVAVRASAWIVLERR